MTRAQAIVWAREKDLPATVTNISHRMFRVRGHLDLDALVSSFGLLERRHPVLRSAFPASATRSGPTIRPIGDGGLRIIEAPSRSDAERLLADWVRTPFDLGAEPLFRGVLVQVAADEYFLCLRAHQLVCDNRSFDLLLHDLEGLYRADRAHWSAPPSPYDEFAVRETSAETAADDLAWWRERLASHLLLDLARDEGDNSADLAAGTERFTLPAPLAKALRSATPFATLLAACRLLLARLAGTGDVCLGASADGRSAGFEGTVGNFADVFALRSTVADDQSFASLVERESRNLADARTHRNASRDRVIEALSPQRFPGRQPYFDVLVNHLMTDEPGLRLAGAVCEAADLTAAEVGRWLTLDFHDRADGGFEVIATYRTAIFSAARVRELLRQLGYLLEQATAAPDQPVSAFSLLTPTTRSQLGDPAQPLAAPTYPSIPELVSHQRHLSPEAEAVRRGGRGWTYAQLWTRAGRLATELRSAGVRPGTVVAISGVMSAGMVAAMLATMMVRAVVMPVDRRLPRARVEMMIDEAGAGHAILVPEEDEATPGWLGDLPVTVVPCGLPADDSVGDEGFTAPDALDPAYVMFTSGTTGRPKRVIGPHAALSHFLDWQRREFQIGPGDRCAQLTGLSFDVLFRDVFLALTSGATLSIPEEADRQAPRQLLTWFGREGITVVHTVPSVARTWLAEADGTHLAGGLRWAFFAGESLDDDLVRRWRDVFPGQIVNLYGPSETVLAKLWHRVPPVPRTGSQPLGTPIPHTQAFVVAADGQRLCGIGEAGEIAVRTPFRSLAEAGPDGARGTRFVPNRWSRDAPADDLVCLTGDRGRWIADGTVEYLGRVDDQVKIRGVRVSPEEVGRELRRLAGVRDAVVLPVTDDGLVSLVAHVVCAPPGAWSASAVRGALRDTLPPAMVPRTVRFLDALPVTRNGKIDRAALRATPPDHQAATTDLPRDDLQRHLASIWCEVLSVGTVGIYDNFFDLGGDSLLLVEVHRRIRDRLSADLPMIDLLRNPTVAALARGLDTAGDPAGQPRLDAALDRGARRRVRQASRTGRRGRTP
jgi:amino acid adenylation domain-containing protein